MDVGNGRKAAKLAQHDSTGEHRLPLTVSRADLLVNGHDQDFRKLVHRLLAFSARLEAIRSQFGALTGLTGVQYTALISIAHLQGEDGVGVKAVADHLGLSGAFLTIVTGQLVKRGLVEKKTNPQDRRRVHLTVTHAGRKLLERLAPIQRDVNDQLFAPLDAQSFRALNAIMAELVHSGDAAAALVDYYGQSGAEPRPPSRARG